MMRQLLPTLFALLALGAMPVLAQTQSAPPTGWPAFLQWKLVPKWIKWDPATKKTDIDWPANNGCVANPVDETLPPGTLIDRFGLQTGSYFSPDGDSFKSRATPYVCKMMDYRVYKVMTPLPVHTCKAAGWFGQPGGARQYKTDDPAQALVDKHVIEDIFYEAGGYNLPAPQCRGS